jgi:hypothetical protein
VSRPSKRCEALLRSFSAVALGRAAALQPVAQMARNRDRLEQDVALIDVERPPAVIGAEEQPLDLAGVADLAFLQQAEEAAGAPSPRSSRSKVPASSTAEATARHGRSAAWFVLPRSSAVQPWTKTPSSIGPITSTKPPGLAIDCRSIAAGTQAARIGLAGEEDSRAAHRPRSGRPGPLHRRGRPGRIAAAGASAPEHRAATGGPAGRAAGRLSRLRSVAGAGARQRKPMACPGVRLWPAPGQRHGLGACCAGCRRPRPAPCRASHRRRSSPESRSRRAASRRRSAPG